MSEFGGLLRGIVADNNDPKKLGRLKIRIQSAYGDQPVDNLPWAWPCFGYGGASGMCMFAVPEVGAGVWVMFQNKDGQPDTTYPVWIGVWQSEKEAPEEAAGEAEDAHHYKTIKTTSGHNVVFCDKPGEEFVEVKDKDGNFLRMDDKNESVEIRDKNGCYMLMKDGNIDIHAKGNITVTTDGGITCSANEAMTLSASSDMALSSSADIALGASGDLGLDAGGGLNFGGVGDAVIKSQGALRYIAPRIELN